VHRPRPPRLFGLALAVLIPAAHAAPPAPLPLEPAQIEAMALVFSPATDARWIPVARIPAEIEAAPDSQAAIAAPYAGTLTRVIAAEGRPVRAGDPLLAIASPDWAMAIAEAEGRLARRDAAQRQADRARALLDAGVMASRDAEAQRAEAVALGAGAQADRALLASARLGDDGSVLLRAPIAGVLMQRVSGVGEPVAAGQLLARIGTDEQRRANGHAPARLAGQIAPGMRASVGDAVGDVVSVAGAIDPATRAIAVAANLPAAAGLPGALVELSISREAGAGMRQVPASAVIGVGGRDTAFVRGADGIAPIAVDVAYRDGSSAWVSGLPADAEVVSRGVLALKAVAESLADGGEG